MNIERGRFSLYCCCYRCTLLPEILGKENLCVGLRRERLFTCCGEEISSGVSCQRSFKEQSAVNAAFIVTCYIRVLPLVIC